VFENHFEEFSKPEILRMPIEGIVLQMKSMNIDAVVNFPFPTPPDRKGLRSAEELLTHLGALEPVTATRMVGGAEKKGTLGGKITELGKAMASFPVTPRFAKMLVIGVQHGCLPFVVAIVAGLSVGDPFLREEALGLAPEENEDGNEEEDLEEVVPEMKHIRDADLRAKEERKAKRRAFYASQAVSIAFFASLFPSLTLLSLFLTRSSNSPHTEELSPTSSSCWPSSAHRNTRLPSSRSVGNTF
jgi:ATP-dependent RNA helicase DHX37/DHR1